MEKKPEKKNDKIFDWLNNLYTKKLGLPTDAEIAPMIWQLNNFLSMDLDLLEYVAYYQKYMYTLKEKYYLFWYVLIPKCPAQRNKYLKIKKEPETDLVKRLSSVMGLSFMEVADYLKILRKTHTEEEIYNFLGMEKK